MDDLEELANRLEELIVSYKITQSTVETQTLVHSMQSELNYLFNQNFVQVHEWLYGRNNLSAMAIEGEI